MKIAIASIGEERTSNIDSRFGRCQYFQIVDLNIPDNVTVVDNPGRVAQRGAGVSTGQFIAEQKVEMVVAGNFGPNAVRVLESAGIKMISKPAGLTVEQVIQELLNGEK
jgi:predicted Fe-Mo cluster-binding NifX family protein